jgi:arginine utilization protein RocB
MTLRSHPVERDATLPDGRVVRIRIGVPDDSYISQKELDTVTIEIYGEGEHLAAVSTVLDAEQTSEARGLAEEIVIGLESGRLLPTAGALEPLADNLR